MELQNINSSNKVMESKILNIRTEIKESKEHISVITAQNKELTSELKEYEKQSEENRRALDRRAAVERVSQQTQEFRKSSSTQNILKSRNVGVTNTASFGGDDISPIA